MHMKRHSRSQNIRQIIHSGIFEEYADQHYYTYIFKDSHKCVLC